MIRDHELAFYDRYLRDEANDWEDRPPLELFVLGANEWRGESEWPLPGTEFTPFFLRSGGGSTATCRAPTSRPTATLRPRGPGADDRRRQLGADDDAGRAVPIRPGPATSACSRRGDDVLSYTSDELDHDLEVIGPVEMVLFAASSAKDTDFFVRVCDVYPDGRSIFLTEGMIRARYRELARGRQRRSCWSRARSPSTGSAATRWRTSSQRATGSAST